MGFISHSLNEEDIFKADGEMFFRNPRHSCRNTIYWKDFFRAKWFLAILGGFLPRSGLLKKRILRDSSRWFVEGNDCGWYFWLETWLELKLLQHPWRCWRMPQDSYTTHILSFVDEERRRGKTKTEEGDIKRRERESMSVRCQHQRATSGMTIYRRNWLASDIS